MHSIMNKDFETIKMCSKIPNNYWNVSTLPFSLVFIAIIDGKNSEIPSSILNKSKHEGQFEKYFHKTIFYATLDKKYVLLIVLQFF